MKDGRNIYKAARQGAGITQEKAAELLDMSVESVRAYETNQRVPPDDVAVLMADVYGCHLLAYEHLRASVAYARELLPEVTAQSLPLAILRLQKEVNDFLRLRDEMVDITCDGVITSDERPAYDAIMRELDDICRAVMTLKFAREEGA